MIHFNKNEHSEGSKDRHYKIRPLINTIRASMFTSEETIVQSVDEVMISYKGTRACNLRQYIVNKPDKFEFKFFARASTDGIIHDIIPCPYQGSTTFDHIETDFEGDETNMLLSTKVAIALYDLLS